MQLSRNFTLAELEASDTGAELGIDNSAPASLIPSLSSLASLVLQPIRDQVGALKVTSGYRSPALTLALQEAGYSPSTTSDHPKGRAADVLPLEVSQLELWAVVVTEVRKGLPCDQAILYPEKGHVHLSWRPNPRRELLISDRQGTRPWSEVAPPPDDPDAELELEPQAEDLGLEESTQPKEDPMHPQQIQVTRETVEEIKAELKRLGAFSIAAITSRLADGRLTLEEANELLEDVLEEGIDGAAVVADALIVLPEPWEATVDLAITAGAAELKRLVAPHGARIVLAVDDFVGPQLERLERKLDRATSNGRSGRVAEFERRILTHFPESERAEAIREAHDAAGTEPGVKPGKG